MTVDQMITELNRRALPFGDVQTLGQPWWFVSHMTVTLVNGCFVASTAPHYIARDGGVEVSPDDLLEMLAFSDALKALAAAEIRHWNDVILPRRRQ